MPEQRIIGYWWSKAEPHYPMPAHSDAPHPHKEEILAALKRKEKSAISTQYRGWSRCRCCGEQNGSREFITDKWRWPEGLSHYVSENNVDLAEFYPGFAAGLMRSVRKREERDHVKTIPKAEKKPEFTLSVREVKERAMLETKKRYAVFINGERLDPKETIYYNMSGYNGYLYTQRGTAFSVGECGISEYKKAAAIINAEAKAVLDGSDWGSLPKVENVLITGSEHHVEVTSGDSSKLVRKRTLRVGELIFGKRAVPYDFVIEAKLFLGSDKKADITRWLTEKTSDERLKSVVAYLLDEDDPNLNDADRDYVLSAIRNTKDEIRGSGGAVNDPDYLRALCGLCTLEWSIIDRFRRMGETFNPDAPLVIEKDDAPTP